MLLHSVILLRYNWLSLTYQKTHRILQRSIFGKWKYVSGNWLKYSEGKNFLQFNITRYLVVLLSNMSIRNNRMVSAVSLSSGHQKQSTAVPAIEASSFLDYVASVPILVVVWCKVWVYGSSLAGIEGSNPVGGMDVCLLWVLCVIR